MKMPFEVFECDLYFSMLNPIWDIGRDMFMRIVFVHKTTASL